jgi:hypothetical protein
MGNWEGLNRRKFPRVNYPCLVVIRNAEGGSQNVILTHTENVGVGGVCLILKQDLAMFSKVDLELDLLDLGEHIHCTGKVMWNVQRKEAEGAKPSFYDIGVEFENLPLDAHYRLEKIVKCLYKTNPALPRKA